MIISKNNALANSKSLHKFSNYPCLNNILLTIKNSFVKIVAGRKSLNNFWVWVMHFVRSYFRLAVVEQCTKVCFVTVMSDDN